MQVGYLYDPVFLEHTHIGHPEDKPRLEAVMALLTREKMLEQLVRVPFFSAMDDQLRAVHDPAYLFALEQYAGRGGGMIDINTYVHQGSYRAASAAAGASIAAACAVMNGEVLRAFALIRPPGHHAYADHASGFCLMNNMAFATLAALGEINGGQVHPAARVAIVDFDVHHGDGTQDIFYDDPRVLYISMHQEMIFPGSGKIEEIGVGKATGTTVDIPFPAGVGDNGYAHVFEEIITPLLRRFMPELILVSAGYDAHWLDHVATMAVSLDGFTLMVKTLANLSNELCSGRMVVILEGGYDLKVLSYGVLNTFHVLKERSDCVINPLGLFPDRETSVGRLVSQVKQMHGL
jgi:acetoin utilization deacetylase AcuC-like enzyme